MQLKSCLKKKFLRNFFGGALITGLLPFSNAFAALPALPTSGTCAFLLTSPVSMNGFTGAQSQFGTIDFSTNKINYRYFSRIMGVAYAYSGGFSAGTTTAPSGASAITFPLTVVNTTMVLNLIAVNGGNTILIQEDVWNGSGVCQF